MTFRAVDPVEAAQADFRVCMRVADLMPLSMMPPAVQEPAREQRKNSHREPCGRCGNTILVANDQPAGPPCICTHCHEDVKAMARRAALLSGKVAS